MDMNMQARQQWLGGREPAPLPGRGISAVARRCVAPDLRHAQAGLWSLHRFRKTWRLFAPRAREGFIVALALLVSGSARADDKGDRDKAARIDQLVAGYQQCGYLNGAVLVAQHGHVLYANGVGEANLESHT